MDKDALLAAIDFRQFYGRYLKLPERKGPELMASCPWHGKDKKPSLSINIETGLYLCHTCGEAGDIFTLYGKLHNTDFITSLQRISEDYNIIDEAKTVTANIVKSIPEATVQQLQKQLLDSPKVLSYLHKKRGLTDETIAKYEIGYIPTQKRLTLPVRNAAGKCINIRRYYPGKDEEKMKSWGKTGYGTTTLYPDPNINAQDLVLCEGEWDCLLARQNGIDCWTHTNGAEAFPKDTAKLFKGKTITICYDIDDAGSKGSKNTAGILYPVAASVKIANLPLTEPENGDITDWFVRHNLGLAEFRAVIDNAEPYRNGSAPEDMPDVVWFETLDHHHTEWVKAGLLARKGITILAGEPGAGKTTLAAEVIFHIAVGEPHWGEPVVQGKTMWLGYDDAAERIRDEKIELLGEIPPQSICTLTDPPCLNETTLSYYKTIIQKHNILVIVADTVLDWFALQDYDKTAPMRAAMDLARRLAEDTGVAILGICHVSKDPTKQGVSRISNSTQITAKCDIAAILWIDHSEPNTCKLNIAKNRLGPSGWNAKLLKEDGRFIQDTSTPRPHTTIEKVFTVISGTQSISRPDLNARFNGVISERAIGRAIKRLEETGQIVKEFPGGAESDGPANLVIYCIPSCTRGNAPPVQSVQSVQSESENTPKQGVQSGEAGVQSVQSASETAKTTLDTLDAIDAPTPARARACEKNQEADIL